MVLVNYKNTFGSLQTIAFISSLVTFSSNFLSEIGKIIPSVQAIQQSGIVKKSFENFIGKIKSNRVIREALKEKIKIEYKQAPEFFNSILNDNLANRNLYDPVLLGEEFIRQRPKCIAPTNKCAKEHYDWINRIETLANYLNEVLNGMGETAISYERQTGKSFDALSYQEQISILTKAERKKVHTSSLENPIIYAAIIGAALLFLTKNK